MNMLEYEIEKLEAARYCRTLDRQSIDMLLDSAIATIKELSAKVASDNMERSSQYYHDGWIPCSERLPSDYGNYLATMDNDDVQEVTYYDNYKKWSTCEADGHKWLNDSEVIAWRPLPEPYEGE